MPLRHHCVCTLLFLALPVAVHAQFTFTTNSDGSLNISAYTGSGGNVVIPETTNGLTVTTIGNQSFESGAVTGVTIPDSITTIGSEAFQFSGLLNVSIPASATTIEDAAFSECFGLTNFSVDPANPTYSSLKGVFFDKAQHTLIEYPPALATSLYIIPNSVSGIATAAFAYCEKMTGVTIPSSVTSLGNAAFFNSGLATVSVPGNVGTIPYEAFASCGNLTNVIILSGVTSIVEEAFQNSPHLNHITIPGTVTTIGESAFQSCSGLASLTIPYGVIAIDEAAFIGCTGLTNVIVARSVTTVGLGAFEECTGLKGAYFQGNAPPDSGTAFSDDPAIVYYLPGTIGWGATFGSVPTALWYLASPSVLTFESPVGIKNNKFGFPISWATNASVIVQACTNLSHPVWIPVATNILSNGTNYFTDPTWTNFPRRCYRVAGP